MTETQQPTLGTIVDLTPQEAITILHSRIKAKLGDLAWRINSIERRLDEYADCEVSFESLDDDLRTHCSAIMDVSMLPESSDYKLLVHNIEKLTQDITSD